MQWQGKIEFKKPITLHGKPHGVEHETTLLPWSSEDEGRVVHAEDSGALWFATSTGWVELTPGGVGAHDHDDMYYTETEVDAMFEGKNGEKQIVDWTNVNNKPTTFAPETHTHDEYLEPSEITYSFLSGQGLIGSGINQVAEGNHTHSEYSLDGHTHASDVITYDNATSGMAATDVKTAIDELDSAIESLNINAATFEALDSAGDVGTGADQVAAGDHNHDGVYALEEHTHTEYSTTDHQHSALTIAYDHVDSGLSASNVKAAIDEVQTNVENIVTGVMDVITEAPIDTPDTGTFRLDTVNNILYIYNGTSWVSTTLS